MKLRITLLVVFLGLLPGLASVLAQTDVNSVDRIQIRKSGKQRIPADSLLWPKHKINFTPYSLFSTYHPGIEVGYERLLNNRFSIESHISLLTDRDNEYARNTRGFILGFETKYYRNFTSKSRWYYALAIEWLDKQHDAELHFTAVPYQDYQTLTRSDYFSRMVTVDKSFLTLTARIGVQQYITSRFILEVYFGGGIRDRDVKHINADNIPGRHFWRDYRDWDIEYDSNKVGSERIFKPEVNVRLAWTF